MHCSLLCALIVVFAGFLKLTNCNDNIGSLNGISSPYGYNNGDGSVGNPSVIGDTNLPPGGDPVQVVGYGPIYGNDGLQANAGQTKDFDGKTDNMDNSKAYYGTYKGYNGQTQNGYGDASDSNNYGNKGYYNGNGDNTKNYGYVPNGNTKYSEDNDKGYTSNPYGGSYANNYGNGAGLGGYANNENGYTSNPYGGSYANGYGAGLGGYANNENGYASNPYAGSYANNYGNGGAGYAPYAGYSPYYGVNNVNYGYSPYGGLGSNYYGGMGIPNYGGYSPIDSGIYNPGYAPAYRGYGRGQKDGNYGYNNRYTPTYNDGYASNKGYYDNNNNVPHRGGEEKNTYIEPSYKTPILNPTDGVAGSIQAAEALKGDVTSKLF